MSANKKGVRILFLAVVAVLFLVAVLPVLVKTPSAHAIDTISVTDFIPDPASVGVSKNFTSVKSIVELIFNIIISASSAIFMVIMVIGGVTYLSSSGNEEGTGKAKKMLIDAVIGLMITLSAWGMGTWVLGQLGVLEQSQTDNPTDNGGGGDNPKDPAGNYVYDTNTKGYVFYLKSNNEMSSDYPEITDYKTFSISCGLTSTDSTSSKNIIDPAIISHFQGQKVIIDQGEYPYCKDDLGSNSWFVPSDAVNNNSSGNQNGNIKLTANNEPADDQIGSRVEVFPSGIAVFNGELKYTKFKEFCSGSVSYNQLPSQIAQVLGYSANPNYKGWSCSPDLNQATVNPVANDLIEQASKDWFTTLIAPGTVRVGNTVGGKATVTPGGTTTPTAINQRGYIITEYQGVGNIWDRLLRPTFDITSGSYNQFKSKCSSNSAILSTVLPPGNSRYNVRDMFIGQYSNVTVSNTAYSALTCQRLNYSKSTDSSKTPQSVWFFQPNTKDSANYNTLVNGSNGSATDTQVKTSSGGFWNFITSPIRWVGGLFN